MKIFMSGEEDRGTPERVLGNKADVMFTFFVQQRKPHKRMRAVIKLRRKPSRNR